MTAKQLQEWLITVQLEAVIEIGQYGWHALEHKKIRAVYVSSPQLTMDDVCNAEEEAS